MLFETELKAAMAKTAHSDAGESATSVISQRLAVVLALAVLIMPCGLLIVFAVWLYRHLRAVFARRAARAVSANWQAVDGQG